MLSSSASASSNVEYAHVVDDSSGHDGQNLGQTSR